MKQTHLSEVLRLSTASEPLSSEKRKMQTVVLLADLLNFLLYTDSEVRLQDGIGEVLKRRS